MFEDFINALQNFRMNKMRTFLSLLGVIIGVASVIIITTLGESATANIRGSFGSSGLDQVSLRSGFMNRSSSSSISFNDSFRDDLWKYIPNIKSIFLTNSTSGTLSYGDESASASATCIENGFLEMNNIELAEGSFFDISDNVQGAQKIILGSEIAEALFPDGDALGKTVIFIIQNARFGFEVSGILAEQGAGMVSTTTGVFVPRGFYTKKISPQNVADSVVIQTTDQDLASGVADAIKEYAQKVTGQDNTLSITSMQSMIEQFDDIMGTVTMLLSGIATISLLVGGVGIMNIMIVTVTERRKEIGIRKALGATPAAIRGQFLVESATITLFGGFLGILAGIGISSVAVKIMEWDFAIKWPACILAFVFSAFVGVFFGLSPAARAAKLDPVEAHASE